MTLPSRRWGSGLRQGIYRDPASLVIAILSKPVDCARLMLLVDIPWAHRVWALRFHRFGTSERHHQSHRHRHKTSQTGHGQMLAQVRRWLPHRAIVLVADSSFAALELLEALRQLSTW